MESSSPFGSLPILLGLTSAAVALIILRRLLAGELRHLPGPSYTKFTHLPLKWATITGRKIYLIDELHRKYGPVVRVSPSFVSINDNASVKQVYASVNGFPKDNWYMAINPFPRYGVFNILDSKEAGQRRRLLAHPFSNSSMHTNWERIIRDYVEFTVSQIVAEVKNVGKTDIFRWWTLMANDIACHIMFGEQLGQLKTGEKTEYIKRVEATMLAVSLAVELPWIQAFASRLPFDNIFKSMDSFLSYGTRAVENARIGGSKANVFSGMLKKAGEGQDELDEFTVKVEAGNLLVAASDTTAITLTYLVWCVTKRPEVRKKLERELATLPENFSDSDLESLEWMNAVINETLRLYGAASGGLPRAVPEGGSVVHGYSLPAGVTVVAQSYSMHRQADVFEDPLVFDPSRFLRELTEEQKIAFAPWGRGSRTCLGIHMAKMELRFAVAMFFRLGVDNPEDKLYLDPSVTDASMVQEDYFLTAPVSHKCEVRLG